MTAKGLEKNTTILCPCCLKMYVIKNLRTLEDVLLYSEALTRAASDNMLTIETSIVRMTHLCKVNFEKNLAWYFSQNQLTPVLQLFTVTLVINERHPLRLCFTINNCPELFLPSMTLAMNTMTGRIPPWQFYILGFVRQIFVVKSPENQWITQPENPKYLSKVRTGSLVYFCIGQQWKQFDLGQESIRRSYFFFFFVLWFGN